ncbi:MAG: histidinol-phosphate transaminase [Planctomycetaceae bacterium]|jgi:histidinol-phosphate aminotransferase|nr:histidinol-phosphate transaminase [Planctomycetaceae bacterium]
MKKYIRPEILAMGGYVPGEQPKPGEAVKLNTNESPYPASEFVYEAIRQVAGEGLSRYPDPLCRTVRSAVAKKFNVPPESVLCGNGSDDLLTILTRTFVGAGETLRLPFPSYILYKSLAEIQGAHSEEIRFNADWSLPPSFSFSPAFGGTGGTDAHPLRLAFLPNPNSPSGTVIPKKRILEIAEELPCPLVVDEAYADFAEEHCMDLVQQCEKIIVCRTMSKSYSLAGLRFGFLVASPKFVEQMIKVKDSYNCDTLSIAAAAAALEDDDWLQNNRRKIIATRRQLTERMRGLGFTVPDSHSNFTWNAHSKIPVKPVYEYLKRNGVLVRYMNYAGWGDGLRISVGTDEQTSRCVDLIAEFI